MKESNDNTMAPHFRKAVVEIDQDIYKLNQDIDRLRCTRNTLVELYGGDEELPPVETIAPTAVQTGGPEKGRRETKRARAAKSDGLSPEQLRYEQSKELEAVRERLDVCHAIGSQPSAADVRREKELDKRGGAGEALRAAERAPTVSMVRVTSFARSCPQPFTAKSLAVGTGEDPKFCSNRVLNWERQGYVVKVARGEFKRTMTFPAETPAE